MQTFNGKKVVTIRDAKLGDPGFDVSKKQSRVELEDHSQATVLTNEVKTVSAAPIPPASAVHLQQGVKPNLDPLDKPLPEAPPMDPDLRMKIKTGRNTPLETTQQLAAKPDVTAVRSE